MEIGRQLGETLDNRAVVCLFGDLAAGKTTLVKGIVEGAANCSADEVSSPTYSYLNIYNGSKTVYHFDLYRFSNSDDFINMGFDELMFGDAISCIEWSERIADLLPKNYLAIEMKSLGESVREIIIK